MTGFIIESTTMGSFTSNINPFRQRQNLVQKVIVYDKIKVLDAGNRGKRFSMVIPSEFEILALP